MDNPFLTGLVWQAERRVPALQQQGPQFRQITIDGITTTILVPWPAWQRLWKIEFMYLGHIPRERVLKAAKHRPTRWANTRCEPGIEARITEVTDRIANA